MMMRSMPPISAHLALMPVPAPPPMIGLPAATWARRCSRHWARVNDIAPAPRWNWDDDCYTIEERTAHEEAPMATVAARNTAARTMTAEEFFDFVHRPENRDRCFELEDGEIVEMALPGERHGVVCANVAGIL